MRLTYELKPTFAVFTETEINQRDYDGVSPDDGLTRNSKGERYRLGIDLGGTGRRLARRGQHRLRQRRQSKASELGDIGAFLFDANLTWRPTEITVRSVHRQRPTSPPRRPRVRRASSRAVAGIEVRHAFRRYLVATAGIAYTDYDYTHVVAARDRPPDQRWR